MNRRGLKYGLVALMTLLVLVYFRIWLLVSNGTSSAPNKQPPLYQTPPFSDQASMIGKTKIAGFCNYNFRSVGLAWYHRLTNLGYDTHILVATDAPMAHYLFSHHKNMRYEISLHEPLPESFRSKPKAKQDHAILELLMAVRWKFLLENLQRGIHVLVTDVDNIFTRYVSLKEFETTHDVSTIVDVWLAYATKFPRKIFGQQGFVVCSGMSWWRASSAAIRFSQVMHETCGTMCDDQRVLNQLLVNPTKLNMTWEWTPEAYSSRITNATTNDPRFLGLPTIGVTGISSVTGHMARVWDRDFAYRGPLLPEPCPPNPINWVSMPIVEAKSRAKSWQAKLDSFATWDAHCGGSRPKA